MTMRFIPTTWRRNAAVEMTSPHPVYIFDSHTISVREVLTFITDKVLHAKDVHSDVMLTVCALYTRHINTADVVHLLDVCKGCLTTLFC